MLSNRIRVGLEFLAWAATVAGAVGIALHFSPSWLGMLVAPAAGAPYLMGCTLVGVVVFLAMRRWRSAGVAIVVVAVAMATQAPLYFGRSGDSGGRAVTVMQANLLFDGADPRAVVNEVRARKVEVLTVDELTPAAVTALGKAGLDRLLPHRYLSPGTTATGTGIWSSHPLSDTVEYQGFVLNQLSATVQIPEAGPVTVFALHPVPPVYSTREWADELSRLHGILDRAPSNRPVIVGGDFNATYDHTQYRAMLSGRFHDAVVQSGAGHLVTYPNDQWLTPLVGIDHILLAEAHAVAVQTVDIPGSDHRALAAQIRLDRRK